MCEEYTEEKKTHCTSPAVERSEDLLVDRQFKTIFFSTIIKINGSFIVLLPVETHTKNYLKSTYGQE